MKILKFLTAIIFAVALPCVALAQSGCPSIINGAVLTAGQWQACFQAKNDVLGFTPMNVNGGVFLGRVVTAPPSSTTAGFNLTPGTAPGSPLNGDLWATGAGFFGQVNGVTVGPFATTSGPITFTGQITTQGLTTTQPGWFVQITGDTVPRVHLGLTTLDVPTISFGSGSATRDAFIQRVGPANLRHGGPDSTTPVAQTISVQNVLTGTLNTAGATLTVGGSRGTGTGAGGDILFQVAPLGSSGAAQNALVNALRINGADGGLTMNGSNDGGIGTISGTSSLNSTTIWSVSNTANGTLSLAGLAAFNGTSNATFGMGGLSYAATPALQNKAFVFSNAGSAGIVLYASGSNPIDFDVNATHVGGFTSTGTFNLGTAGSVVGSLSFQNATSGTVMFTPATGALGSTAITVPATSGTLAVGNTSPITLSAAGVIGCATCLTGNQTITLSGAVTGSGATSIATVYGTQITNSVLGNATSGTASPTALSIGGCSSASSSLIWTTNTGFGCNTSITAAAVPAGGLTGTTLASSVTASSLTSLGTVASLNATAIGAGTPGSGAFTTLTASTSVLTSLHSSSSGNATHSAAAALIFASNGSTYAGSVTTGQLWSFGTNTSIATGNQLMTLTKNAATPPQLGTFTPMLQIVQADATQTAVVLQGFNTGAGLQPLIVYGKPRGTAGSPAANVASDVVGANFAFGYAITASAGYQTGGGTGFNFVVSESTCTTTACGMHTDIYGTPTGTAGASIAASFGAGLWVGASAIDPGAGKIAAFNGFVAGGNAGVTKTCGATIVVTGGIITSC